MTKTIITNPRVRKGRDERSYLNFDLYIGDDSGYFILIRNCIAKRLVNGTLAIRGPVHPRCNRNDFELSFKLRQLLAEKIEEKWGEAALTKAAFTVN